MSSILATSADRTKTPPQSRAIAIWLFVIAAMIMAMVVIGGITRLTESGLSIMEWRPLSGFIPPFSTAEWERVFALYKTIPEYQQLNRGMSLGEFKTIFWWEYVHRLWGRLIGLAFALPLAWFLLRRSVPRGLAPHLFAMLALGAAQGALGWFMVASGFGQRTDVSQYRLVAHLALALAIYGYVLWIAFGLLGRKALPPVEPALRRPLVLVLCLLGVTIAFGGFTAGLDGGMVYNSFPLMGDRFAPSDLWTMSPLWLNLFENPPAAQFAHRWLAVSTVIAILALWIGAGRRNRGLPIHLLALIALLQVSLGVATLLLVVPIPLAALHQAGAVLLLGMAVWALRAASEAR